MRYKLITYGLVGLLIMSSVPTIAQVQVEVMTKTIEKSFDYFRSDAILIRGEKSSIQVKTWANNEVKVKLKLIAKAVSQDIAEKELEYQKYTIEKKKGVISLFNYYELSGKEPLRSVLIAEYEVYVPVFAKITISNSYGNIQVSDKQGEYLITNKFGNIILDNVGGIGVIESYFGDFIARNLSGQNELKFNKTKTVIDGLSGEITIDSQLGDVTIDHPESPLRLVVKASKSDVSIESLTNWDQYNINFKSDFGLVNIPSDLPGLPDKKGNVSYWNYSVGNRSKIKVETSFGAISLSTR